MKISLIIFALAFLGLDVTGELLCQYDERFSKWAQCDRFTNSITTKIPLKPNQSEKCYPVKTEVKPCHQGARKCAYAESRTYPCNHTVRSRVIMMEVLNISDPGCPKVTPSIEPCQNTACEYDESFSKWAQCNPFTNTITTYIPLKRDQSHTCFPVKINLKPCPKGAMKCIYVESRKLSCNYTIRSRVVMMRLVNVSDPDCPKVTPSVEACESPVCKYDERFSTWAQCNPFTNSITSKIPLKANQPDTCYPVKTEDKPCPTAARKCIYVEERKLPCNASVGSRVIMMKLLNASDPGCPKVTPSIEPCQHPVCEYDERYSKWTQCDPLTNSITTTIPLKPGQPDTCHPVKTEVKPCPRDAQKCLYKESRKLRCNHDIRSRVVMMQLVNTTNPNCPKVTPRVETCDNRGCQYDERFSKWAQCNRFTNMITTTIPLKANQLVTCDPVKTDVKPCPQGAPKCAYVEEQKLRCNNAIRSRVIMMRRLNVSDPECPEVTLSIEACEISVCKYDERFSTWTQCNPFTNSITSKIPLIANQPDTCYPVKTENKPCLTGAPKCLYAESRKYPCNHTVRSRIIMMQVLNISDPDCPKVTPSIEPCEDVEQFHIPEVRCHYDNASGTWSECNTTTKVRKKILTLQRLQPLWCHPTKIIEEACLKASTVLPPQSCHYENKSAKWSECDASTNLRKKVFTLRKGQPHSCPSTKILVETCPLDNVYDTPWFCQFDATSVTWNACDPITKKRRGIAKLINDFRYICPQTKTIEKECTTGLGNKPLCNYNISSGTWSKCNKTSMKMRKVVYLEKGDPRFCLPRRTIEKSCTENIYDTPWYCHYAKTSHLVSECDPVTKKRKVMLNLRNDFRDVCPSAAVIYKACPQASDR